MTATSRRAVLGASLAGVALTATGTGRTAAAAPSRPLPPDLRPGGAYDRFAASLAAQDKFSGTVLLVHRKRPVLSRSFGLADKHREVPNGPDTIFATGSINKLFTALAISQLAQRGALEFHRTLGTYLDGFPAEIANAVTIHQLLTHTSGLGDYHQTEAFHTGRLQWDTADEMMAGITKIIRESPLEYPPGAGKRYSNSAYHLLGEIVARLSGRSYHDYMREQVFGAATMTATDFPPMSRWQTDRRYAHPYTKTPAGERVEAFDRHPFIGTPAGNSHASAADLARYVHALLEHRLLDRLYTDIHLGGKLPDRWTDDPGLPPQIAFATYGPISLLMNGQWLFGHNGGAPGISAHLEWFPATDLVSVVLSNYDPPASGPLATFVRKAVTGVR